MKSIKDFLEIRSSSSVSNRQAFEILGDSKAEKRRALLKWDQDKFNPQVTEGKK